MRLIDGRGRKAEGLQAAHAELSGALDRLAQAMAACLAGAGGRDEASVIGAAVLAVQTLGGTHERIEEELLFPILRVAVPDRVDWLDALVAEHERTRTSWGALLPGLASLHHELVRGRQPAPHELAELGARVGVFIGTYRAHMEIEEREIMPLATLLLDQDAHRLLDEAVERARRDLRAPRRRSPHPLPAVS